jgi:hypothetical protein
MFVRLLFAFTLLLGLAVGPALPVENCLTKATEVKCGHCCAAPAADCCASSETAPQQTPPQVAASGGDLKLAVVPVLVCLGAQPAEVVPAVSLQARDAARRPVLPRLAVTCVRLI